MAYGYFKQGYADKIAYFEVFFRKSPDDAGFSIIAGLESIISYVKNFGFNEEEINYLRTHASFDEDFLSYLAKLTFKGDIYALKEGSVAFPHEPILIVRAPIIIAQLMETYILAALNHQSLIATKASRIVRACYPKQVIEYGARRAHGLFAALNGARSAIIAGCVASSNTLACKQYQIPPNGTMAHSWVLMFPSELEAFRAYTRLFSDNLVLLIDTYDTLLLGLPNAIKVFKEILSHKKLRSFGVRLDSGDLCELSKQIRIKLDEAGLKQCKIYVSGGLDEAKIASLELAGAKIDAYGVGEKLITSASSPVFGAVYKLCALEDKGKLYPKMKHSLYKANIPHFKKLVRFYKDGKACYDKLFVYDEEILPSQGFEAKELLEPIFVDSKQVYFSPKLENITSFSSKEVASLDPLIKDLFHPSKYEVRLSSRLENLCKKLTK